MIDPTSQATEETPSPARQSSEDSRTRTAPSKACLKCGAIRWIWNQSGKYGSWRCRSCLTSKSRTAQSGSAKRCEQCGGKLPHRPGKCPETSRRNFITRGRIKLNERWPGYGDALTDEHWLEKIGHGWPKSTYPPPSFVFAGLNPSLDTRLIRVERDKDVAFCRTLAQVPSQEQREYLEIALIDPADAARWVSLPLYQRPIRKGDQDDIAIWKFFTMQRLNMNLAATGRPWDLASQGAQLPQMFGVLARLTLSGLHKLVLVMNGYGYALQAGRPLGNVVKKPWEDR